MKTSFWTVVLAIVSKDLRAEMRSRELLSVMAIFAFLCILVFSFALELDRVAREEAISGVLWVTLIFASLLGFNRSLAQEGDQGNLDAMLLAPVSRSAIFFGKLLGNYLFTLIVALVILPLMTVIYNNNLLNGWLIVTTVVGVFGFCTIGHLAGDADAAYALARSFAADSDVTGGAATATDVCARYHEHT